MVALLVDKFSILLIALDLHELYLYRAAGDNALALGEELLADDALQQ